MLVLFSVGSWIICHFVVLFVIPDLKSVEKKGLLEKERPDGKYVEK